MIEALGIPILVKAVDFLFEEGSRILQERRDRRNALQEAEIATRDTQPAAEEQVPGAPPDTGNEQYRERGRAAPERRIARPGISSREDALTAVFDEDAWLDSEAEISHLVSLLEIHSRNYHLAKEQYAKWGSTLVPPIIVNTLVEEEDAVAATLEELRAAVSRLYSRKITIPNTD